MGEALLHNVSTDTGTYTQTVGYQFLFSLLVKRREAITTRSVASHLATISLGNIARLETKHVYE